MDSKALRKKRARERRNWFLACCISVLAALASVIVYLIMLISSSITAPPPKVSEPQTSSQQETQKPQFVTRGEYELDATYKNLLLVNPKNPLPEDYDYEGALTTIEEKYRQPGYDLNQINCEVYPYLKAMCEAAMREGIELRVCSPYRSYSIQQTLFDRQVQKWKNQGMSDLEADKKAATIVARPGTSEHHTGLAVDFIKANDSFEEHPAFAWLQNHAHEYGFIMRYPKNKEDITEIIYESWHYRFVGIYEAEKIKESGLCLEEYLEKQ